MILPRLFPLFDYRRRWGQRRSGPLDKPHLTVNADLSDDYSKALMYSDPNAELDSPPPRSQFRRPWSPEALTSGADGGVWQNVHMSALSDQGHNQPLQGISSGHQRQRREASDVSVEALDLADYARTLRARQAEDPYPPFPSGSSMAQPKPDYSPSVFPYLPQLASSKDSVAMHPPSLVSRTTLSSLATPRTTSSSAPSHARRATRRPYSLPPTPQNSSQASGSARSRPSNRHHYPHQGQDPYIVDPDNYPAADEIDISNFPKWSRGWYSSNHLSNTHPAAQPDDIYTPIPPSIFGSSRNKTTFNPGNNYDPYSQHDVPPPFSSVGHESSRNLLPWSTDPPEYGPPLNPMLKEERMRLLEREFGNQGKKGKNTDFDDDGKPKVGSVDEKGNLVTSGPKRRIFFRVLQILLAGGACVPAIYASLAIKPLDPKDLPPPANKPPIFVLYILSSLTLIFLLYLFLIRPCCVVRKPSSTKNSPMSNGMMVFPVTGPDARKGGKGAKKGKNKPGGNGSGDVQVNLIVDPEAFQPPDADDSEDDEDDGSMDEGSQVMPGSFERERARRKKRRRTRRRGLMEGLKMEEQWKVARSWAKKVTAVDVAGLVLWSAAFVFIMLGKRCPSGEYNGWCNAYNVSTASACLLAIAFSVSLFYDVQDLFASKQSPRTRG